MAQLQHIIVTGHTGVGKSTIMHALCGRLDAELLDFDSPDFASAHFPDGKVPDRVWDTESGATWRTAATGDWLVRLKNSRRAVILFGGMLPAEFAAHPDHEIVGVRWSILLARPETIVDRLAKRGGPVLESRNVAAWQDHMCQDVRRQPGHHVFDAESSTQDLIKDFLLWADAPRRNPSQDLSSYKY